MVLSKICIIPKGIDEQYSKTIYLEGLDLIKESFIPHYKKEFDKTLKDISKKVDLYAISGAEALYIDLLTKDFEILGNPYLFRKGKKTSVVTQ